MHIDSISKIKIGFMIFTLCLLELLFCVPAFAQYYSVDISSYSNFRNQVLGNAYDIDNENGYQCWDGAALLWQQLGRTLITGNGVAQGTWNNAAYTNAGSDFDLIYSINDVKRGDVVVFGYDSSYFNSLTENGTQCGHIAFADEDYNYSGTLNIMGQNQLRVGAFSVQNVRVSSFLGAFRYKNWGSGLGDPIDVGDDFYASVLLSKPLMSLRPSGDNIVMGSSKGEEMLWHFEKQEDGRYMIRNAGTGKYLTVYGGLSDDHTAIIQKEYTGSYAQRWFVCGGVSGQCYLAASNAAGYSIQKVISPVGNGQTDGTKMELLTFSGSDEQKFVIYKVSKVSAIKSKANLEDSFYATAYMGGNSELRISPDEGTNSILMGGERDASSVWYFQKQSDGSYMIQNVGTGNYLTVEGGVYNNHVRIIQKERTGSYAQRWHIFGRWSGDYYFCPSTVNQTDTAYEEMVIRTAGDSISKGVSLELHSVNWSDSQRFSLYTVNKVKKASLEVQVKDTDKSVVMSVQDSYTDDYGTRAAEEYEIEIWENGAEGAPMKSIIISDTTANVTIPSGNYVCRVISRNFFSEAVSDLVSFSVNPSMEEPDGLLPENLVRIEEEAFINSSMEVIRCPEGLEEIGERAFADSKKLRQIYIPETTASIAKNAFENCGDITIFGVSGSEAERFAEKQKIDFVDTLIN